MIVNIFVIALLVESIVLHEMAHGYVALLFGDRTAKDRGRLTLNPIPHIDPMWTVVIPVVAYILSKGTFIIGGAKPVPVNPYNYQRPVLGDICVSVAGVAGKLFDSSGNDPAAQCRCIDFRRFAGKAGSYSAAESGTP